VIITLFKKIVGTKNERELKRIRPVVVRVNELEPEIKALSDADLKEKTAAFKSRIANGEPLESILPEAFAVVREASIRALGMRHFDVQLIGGVVLHEGKISEMKTGEGKTLVATLPVYLNSLTGKGVHVVTVNDYLARRDAEWMGTIYKFLGLTVGTVVHGLTDQERQWSYNADVSYGTNNEFGFDYLRDNMKYDLSQYVQRPLNYAIVDEVDSILIDEARTPLIISGPAEESTELYYIINGIIPYLKQEKDYTLDEKSRAVMLSEGGVANVEQRLNVKNLYDPQNINLLHHVNQALRAHTLFKKDVDYIVKDGQVMIVDEFTGRLMPGRRWSDGLHQAVEAKEGVKIENENQTLATITFQNYFRMYNKLAGMTGTADTEAAEFAKIYNLDVMIIPTHMPMIRMDNPDLIYKTTDAKFKAVVEEIKDCHEKGQPVLVGTISIEKSELVSKMLTRFGIPHHVLNAKHHEKEAEIVAQAGRYKGVTISTNMAGRGTDIILGGNPVFLARTKVGKEAGEEEYQRALSEFKKLTESEKQKVIAAGGMHILGTERHEARRIDNQLRGRSGRQGDPGSSRFYLSLEDDLLRIFGGERISTMMERLGMEEDEEITHPWLTHAIANAQKKVEGHNFLIRKSLLEYDDVMSQQRKSIYKLRREILAGSDTKDMMLDQIDQIVTGVIEDELPDRIDSSFDAKPLEERVRGTFNMPFSFGDIPQDKKTKDSVGQRLYDSVVNYYDEREAVNTTPIMRQVEKIILLQTLDGLWKDHLLQMDHLREGVSLRGYGQKDPLLEYKKEGYLLFRNMMDQFTLDVVQKAFRVQVTTEESVARAAEAGRRSQQTRISHREVTAFAKEAPNESRGDFGAPVQTVQYEGPKVGRNDPCPCGSGKKYKKCCGK